MREIPMTSRPAFAFLLSICVLHLGIRLYLINQQGFFFEETTTWSYSRSLESLILAMMSDVHPPLYFALMSMWTKLFGTSEIAFRLPSVLGSFLTLITLMVFARELDQRRNLVLAILVGALYVCLPYDIHLSKTARSWTMTAFLCSLFSYLYVNVTLRDKKNWFVGSLIVAVCAVFVHYIAILSVAAAVTAATLIQPTKANLHYAGKTLGIIFIFLLPCLLLVFPFQLIAKANIPFHFHFFWEQNAVSILLEPINPGTWNPFFPIEESAGVFHGIGLFLALVGVTLVLFRAGVCWANRLTRFLMLQVVIMIVFLLLSPTPLCNQRTMCIFLPPFLLLLSFTLEDLFTSKRLPAVLVSGVFVISFVAMSLSGFPIPPKPVACGKLLSFFDPVGTTLAILWRSCLHLPIY
ncbi:MAG: glycosyltransferase family 39 protein [Desulfobaccales bacterium]